LIAPKKTSSIRTINLGAVLVSALKRHRGAAGWKKPNGFAFCKKDGFPFDPDVLRKDVLYPILDRLGIPRPSGASGFHAFRDSVRSFINAQMGNLKLAQNFLGQTTINMTADVHTHVSRESKREAAEAVERAIYGDLFPIREWEQVRSCKLRLESVTARLVTINKKGA
jgi:integrase